MTAHRLAIHVVLTADHAGLPAGTEILVGHAEAAPSTPVEAPAATTPTTTTPAKPGSPAGVPAKGRKPLPRPPEPDLLPNRPGSVFRLPPTDVSAPLSPGGYVFPVYGPSSFTDTFRAARAGVGWHHGDERPRAGLARSRAARPGLPGRQHGARRRLA